MNDAVSCSADPGSQPPSPRAGSAGRRPWLPGRPGRRSGRPARPVRRPRPARATTTSAPAGHGRGRRLRRRQWGRDGHWPRRHRPDRLEPTRSARERAPGLVLEAGGSRRVAGEKQCVNGQLALSASAAVLVVFCAAASRGMASRSTHCSPSRTHQRGRIGP